MRTFHALKMTLALLALVAGTRPAAATGSGQQDPRPIQTGEAQIHELHVQAFHLGTADGYFSLDGPPLPRDGVGMYWLDAQRQAWVRCDLLLWDESHIHFMNPSGSLREVDFLVTVQGEPWGHAHYLPASEAVDTGIHPAPEAALPPATEAERQAVLALCMDPQAPPQEGAGAEGEKAPTPPGNLTSGDYLWRIMKEYGLRQADIAAETPDPRSTASALSDLLRRKVSGTRQSMSYSMAERIAGALNRINAIMRRREQPFTALELFLAGKPLKSLPPGKRLQLILNTDRQINNYDLSAQMHRLGLNNSSHQAWTREEKPIPEEFVARLKALLDFPALGMTEADLEDLASSTPAPRKLDRPGRIRALALYDKASMKLGFNTNTVFCQRVGIAESTFSKIRGGHIKVSAFVAQKLNEFHNREFSDEPPTTPEYFLGR